MRFILIVTTTCLLAFSSYAQISGCNAVDCPTAYNGDLQCVIGNATASAIGALSFNTSLSPQPLTWTLIIQSPTSLHSQPQQELFERDFFLGTPPSLNLSQNTSATSTRNQQAEACSLFFEGVAPRLRFPGSDREYDQGTCNDALGAQCFADLQAQAQSELSKILNNSTSRGTGSSNSNSISNSSAPASSVCDALGTSLRDKAPTSCTVAYSGGHWGSILSRPLTGPQSPRPVQQRTCYPTTVDRDYELRLIAKNQTDIESLRDSDIMDFMFGITPIMTVVYGGGNGRDDQNAEIDLSCLKPINTRGSGRGLTPEKDSGTVGNREARGTVLMTTLAGFFLLFLYWGCL